MPDISPNLDLPYLMPSQAQKHITHNEALRRLDLVVQLRLEDTATVTPPPAPTEGAVYGLGAGAGGAWAGQQGRLAAWLDNGWQFFDPQTGWRAWDAGESRLTVWDGSAWVPVPQQLDELDRIGIATTADTINRLAVRAPASLFSHEGAGHQLKINKAADTDTASLLFQSGWTGHAEMGLSGQAAFSVKVSPDGSNWTESLRLDETTGLASGNAVQSDTADATAGRLMRVGGFGLGETGTGAEIADIDASDTPAGLYRMQAGTAGNAGLPGMLAGEDGLIRVERFDAGTLRQTAWRGDLAGGIWTRARTGGAWNSWTRIIDHASLLGPVSESGGQPTGAVLERGSGPDGDYLRMTDGTQICSRTFDTAASSHAWSFPLPFAAPPVLQALPRSATVPRIATENGDLTAEDVSFSIWDTGGNAAASALHATATGRWF